jgi:alpha-tubulin suppressor-like RCC1 family protein
MTTRYPGGLIRKTPPTIIPPAFGEGGSAPGVWTLEQASYYTKQGTWPLPTINVSGALYTFGSNGIGKLGLNDRTYRSSPTQVGSETTWKFVAGAGNSSLAIKNNGTLWGWGYNLYGQIGDQSIIYRSSPVQVGALTTWARVFKSANNSWAIKNDGTLWAWGRNENGSLGLGDEILRSSPVQIGTGTWAYVAGVDRTTAAIQSNGTLWTWGDNENIGALGSNQGVARRSSPVQVGSLSNWLYVSADSIGFHSIKTDYTLWGWGWNDNGQIGDGTKVNRSSPVQVGALTNWLKLANSPAYKFGIATKNDNTLWSWGLNNVGQLGTNQVNIDYSSPVQVGADTTWLYISTTYTGVTAIKSNGTLWAWGGNSDGQLGQNDRVARSSPTQIGSDTTWLRVFGGNSFAAVTKG